MSDTPFTVLHVCLGNICRSPMAERLLVARFAERLAAVDPTMDPAALLRCTSVGTGGWHVGNPMSAGSARQLALRGASSIGFEARPLSQVTLAESDLILTATAGQRREIEHREPAVAGRTFPLLQFGRLACEVGPSMQLPSTVRQRGVALAAKVAELAARQRSVAGDDLTDPYGCGDELFSQVADEINDALVPLVAVLAAASAPA